nr:TonB C-terminal domain-containing protein [Desulfobulbaceae bacterium]
MSFSGHTAALYLNRIGPIRWMPLLLTVGVHFLTFILLLFPPTFFIPDRDIPEIQTINLFTVEEFEQKTQTPPPPVAKPPREEPPVPQENLQSIATETPPPSQSSPAEVISLHPRRVKKKIVQEVVEPKPPLKQDIKRQNAIERIQSQVNQKKEEQQLKHNLARLRDSLHSSVKDSPQESQAEDSNQQQPTAPASQGENARINAAERSYFIAVQRRILDNWALPKTQDWDSNLEALVIIYISKTGVISKTVFEKKSKNVYFNQYVEKTIRAAAPMPPIPSALKKNTLEIGLRFKPSGLF